MQKVENFDRFTKRIKSTYRSYASGKFRTIKVDPILWLMRFHRVELEQRKKKTLIRLNANI